MTPDRIDVSGRSLVLAFVTGTGLRARNDRAVVGLVDGSPDRRPELRALVKTHRATFLRGPTAPPLALTPALVVANGDAAHSVWPGTRIPPAT